MMLISMLNQKQAEEIAKVNSYLISLIQDEVGIKKVQVKEKKDKKGYQFTFGSLSEKVEERKNKLHQQMVEDFREDLSDRPEDLKRIEAIIKKSFEVGSNTAESGTQFYFMFYDITLDTLLYAQTFSGDLSERPIFISGNFFVNGDSRFRLASIDDCGDKSLTSEPPKNQPQDAPLFTLPDEVLVSVMEYLGSEVLACLAQTCRRLAQLANDNVLWSKVTQREITTPLPSTLTTSFYAFIQQNSKQVKEEDAQFCHKFRSYFRHLYLLSNPLEFNLDRPLNVILNIARGENGIERFNPDGEVTLTRRKSNMIEVKFTSCCSPTNPASILLSKLKFEQFKFLILSGIGDGKKKQIEGQVYLDVSDDYPGLSKKIKDEKFNLILEKMIAKFPGEVETCENHPYHLKIGPQVQAFIEDCKKPQEISGSAPKEELSKGAKQWRLS